MNSRVSQVDTGIGVSFTASAVIHVAVFLLVAWWGRLFPLQMPIQETYYVDVVSLPVVNPQQGGPQKSAEAEPPPVPAPPVPMTVPTPAKTAPKGGAKKVPALSTAESGETESAFAERMAKLEGKAEAQQYEERIKRLSSKTKTTGNVKSGAPAGTGTEAGSRYADFIKSRLEDALKVTSYYTTQKPEVAVRLTISAEGRLTRMRIERSSGDAAFELAVRRAIDLASEKFTAPPTHTAFENGFVFRPKGITNGTR
jgi:colicin import membrane protein